MIKIQELVDFRANVRKKLFCQSWVTELLVQFTKLIWITHLFSLSKFIFPCEQLKIKTSASGKFRSLELYNCALEDIPTSETKEWIKLGINTIENEWIRNREQILFYMTNVIIFITNDTQLHIMSQDTNFYRCLRKECM